MPALDQRRARFEREYEFRQRVMEDRYDLIRSSRGESVPFTALGTDTGSPEKERKAAAKKKMQSAVSKLKGINVLTSLGGNGAGRGGAGEEEEVPVVPVVWVDAGTRQRPPPKKVSDVKAKDLMGKTRKKEQLFHDGKAAAAIARVQGGGQRGGQDARDGRGKKRWSARHWRRNDACARSRKRRARVSRAVLSKMRAGSAVVMDSAATAIEDNRPRRRRQEKERLAAVPSPRSSTPPPHSRPTKEAEDAAARLESTVTSSRRWTSPCSCRRRIAARAAEIVAELRAGGQEDAAECAAQTVTAWRARADAITAEADTLRGDCDALEETVEVVEGQVAAAAVRLEEETQNKQC